MTDAGAGRDRRPGRPRDPDLDGTILRATMELLCQEGFTGTSVEAVAERAGVGKATIYRRWPTREDLLLAAGGEMGPCPPDPDCGNLRDDLLVLIGGLVSMLAGTPVGALLPATVDEAARNPEMRARLDAFIAERRAPVRAALDRAADRGELRGGVDHELVVDLMAGPVFTRVLLTGRPLGDGLAAEIVDTVLGGVWGGRGARPRPRSIVGMTLLDVHAELAGLIRPLRRIEYDRMVELGMFADEPIELLEGALVEMGPEGSSHAWVIQELLRLLARGLPEHLRLRVGNPLAAGEWSEPEPDLAVVPVADYRREHPAQAVLLIEISRSSPRKDLGVKARIYAAAGVPEYWVVDVGHGIVHRHREPSGDGYGEVIVHGADAVLDACGVEVRVGELLEGLD